MKADHGSSQSASRTHLGKPVNPSGKYDLTGRDRMVWNVLASWVGQLAFVLAGFVMPRMIDRYAGQAALGIWDFSWSLVSYFGLANLGVGSSVNRYVASYRAVNDTSGLNRAVTSVLAFQFVAGLTVTAVTAIFVHIIPMVWSERLGVEIEPARQVVTFLGMSIAVQVFFEVFRGVITGCHRWDLHNAVNSGFYLLSVVGMVGALVAGKGLLGLAVVYFIGVVLAEVVRVVIAFRVCPELRIHLRHARWKEAKDIIAFGMKGLVAGIPSLIVLQGTSLIIGGTLGPEALALFTRPLALVRNVEVFINKFAMVLGPTAGSLQSTGRMQDLAEMLIGSTRTAAYLAMPILTFFAFLGDSILHLWMGPRYQPGMILVILSIGFLLPLLRQSVISILIGMNLHGRIAVISLVVTLLSFAASAFAVDLHGWTLDAASVVVAISLSLGMGLVVIILGCAKIGVPLQLFLVRILKGPVLCTLPFALSLVVIRAELGGRPGLQLILGIACGAGLLGPLYWRYVIPARMRKKILNFVCVRNTAASSV